MALINYGVLFIMLCIISWKGVLTQQNSRCVTPDQKIGVCIFIRNCKPLLDLVKNQKWNPEVLNFLQKSTCGYDGGAPKVCCQLREQQSSWITLIQPTTWSPTPSYVFNPTTDSPESSVADVSFHPRLRSLLPESCGTIDLGDKIWNGEQAGLFEFPWMAALGYLSANNALSFLCGGSLINQRYVLTAAHCLKNLRKYRLTLVRLGEYDMNAERDCDGYQCAPPVQNINVERVIIHERYSSSDKRHDIGLVKLREDAVFNQAVKPICLPIGREEQTRSLEDGKVVVTGWGRTESGPESSILLKVSLPVVSVKRCAQIYSAVRIFPSQICAGGKEGKDSCTGDSGGPLQSTSFKSGEPVFTQYGLVSFGPQKCGKENKPGVYTRVGFYMKWILDNMDS